MKRKRQQYEAMGEDAANCLLMAYAQIGMPRIREKQDSTLSRLLGQQYRPGQKRMV